MPFDAREPPARPVQDHESALTQRRIGRHGGSELIADGRQQHRHVLPVGADDDGPLVRSRLRCRLSQPGLYRPAGRLLRARLRQAECRNDLYLHARV
jgi:hypothetical protein